MLSAFIFSALVCILAIGANGLKLPTMAAGLPDLQDEFLPDGYMPTSMTKSDFSSFARQMSSPTKLSCDGFPGCQGQIFNPSLIELPSSMNLGSKGTGPLYAAAVRSGHNLCETFLGGTTTPSPNPKSTEHMSVLLFDSDMTLIDVAPIKGNGKDVNASYFMGSKQDPARPGHTLESFVVHRKQTDLLQPIYDGRLFSTSDEIMFTYVTGMQTHLQTLLLSRDVRDGSLDARVDDSDMHYVSAGILRNSGLMWNGTDLSMLVMPAHPGFDPEVKYAVARSPRNFRSLAELGNISHNDFHLHNNINPVKIPEANAYLGVMHRHLQYGTAALYGSHYVHHFFLFDLEQPHFGRHMSSGFCIPTRNDPMRCEVIQFISSIVRIGDDFVIGYGANDCEAYTVKVPVRAVLDFCYNGTASDEYVATLGPNILDGHQIRRSGPKRKPTWACKAKGTC